MKHILFKNTTETAFVDDKHFERLSKFTWILSSNKLQIKRFVTKTVHKHITNKETGEVFKISKRESLAIPLANEIMQKFDCIFDHKDRNPFNNLENNLRECSHQENMFNCSKQKATSSVYKGVTLTKQHSPWRSKIQHNGVTISIGSYLTEEEAASAYNKKAIELFKNFAVLNMKDGKIL